MTRATTSTLPASITLFAPMCLATLNFPTNRSTGIIVPAPATFAPITALNPTPPSPNTTTDSPGETFAVLITAPTPVKTAQPNNAAVSSGNARSITTSDSAAQTVNCENPET